MPDNLKVYILGFLLVNLMSHPNDRILNLHVLDRLQTNSTFSNDSTYLAINNANGSGPNPAGGGGLNLPSNCPEDDNFIKNLPQIWARVYGAIDKLDNQTLIAKRATSAAAPRAPEIVAANLFLQESLIEQDRIKAEIEAAITPQVYTEYLATNAAEAAAHKAITYANREAWDSTNVTSESDYLKAVKALDTAYTSGDPDKIEIAASIKAITDATKSYQIRQVARANHAASVADLDLLILYKKISLWFKTDMKSQYSL